MNEQVKKKKEEEEEEQEEEGEEEEAKKRLSSEASGGTSHLIRTERRLQGRPDVFFFSRSKNTLGRRQS